MNKTKRKILDTALDLLNEHGIAQISQRSISDYLKISPGNLTYHYKKKADIIEAIYFELVEQMDIVFEELNSNDSNIEVIIKTTDKLFKILFDYRFFFIDIVQILRNHESITLHYRALQTVRKEQFHEAIQMMSFQGIIRPQELPNEYEELYNRIQIIFDFYLSFISVNNKKIKNNHIQEQKKAFLYTIYPYLTEPGKKFFSTII